MKTVKAKITFEYDFSDMIAMMNEERDRAGETEMTDDEIKEAVKEDLADFDFRDTCGELPVEVYLS